MNFTEEELSDLWEAVSYFIEESDPAEDAETEVGKQDPELVEQRRTYDRMMTLLKRFSEHFEG